MYTVSSMATGVDACQPRGWYTLLFPINALPIWEYIAEILDDPVSVFIVQRFSQEVSRKMDEDGVRVLRRQLADLHLQLLTLLNRVRDMEDSCVQVLGNEHKQVVVPPSHKHWDYTNLNGC